MTYKINGTELDTQPTSGRWMPRDNLGIDGQGHAVYSSVREFELKWQASDPFLYDQLQTFYESQGNTGTSVVDLPYYVSGSYSFFSYSGCVLREPEMGEYFSEHHTDIFLLITNIRT